MQYAISNQSTWIPVNFWLRLKTQMLLASAEANINKNKTNQCVKSTDVNLWTSAATFKQFPHPDFGLSSVSPLKSDYLLPAMLHRSRTCSKCAHNVLSNIINKRTIIRNRAEQKKTS